MIDEQERRFFEFGPFRIDPAERVLWRAGESIALTSKLFDILLLLVQNHGRVIEKERLMNEIWPGAFVEEGNLTQNISVLRKALKDDGHQYIQTVPRRGYRFVGHVHEVADESELIIEEHSLARLIVEEQQTHLPAGSQPFPGAAGFSTPSEQRISQRRHLQRPLLVISIAVAGTAIVLSSFAFLLRRKENASLASSSSARSIAVLPFQTLTTDTTDEWVGLGITDALISKLSEIRELKIRPTSAVRKFSGRERNATEAGRELGVDSVLEGNVQRDGEILRVSVQLIDVKEGRTIWSSAIGWLAIRRRNYSRICNRRTPTSLVSSWPLSKTVCLPPCAKLLPKAHSDLS